MFLKNFSLLRDIEEYNALDADRRKIYTNYYPFGIFVRKELNEINFDNITIFYGNNGSGKSTLLNIIADKLNATRLNSLNKGNIFKVYVDACSYKKFLDEPEEIKIITSDDIFDYLLDIRSINAGVNRKKESLSIEYLNNKYSKEALPLNSYYDIKTDYEIKKKSLSYYVRNRLINNTIIEQSNGESALMFWEKEIGENGIYILDEPENSLSAENIIKLKKFIEDSVRYFNCQFIISTHSPFLLALNEALIYDLDSEPVITKNWTDLPNIQVYYNFFKEYNDKFTSS